MTDRTPSPLMTRPEPVWVRSSHGWIFGICEGLGRRLNIEPWVLRAIWILSVLFLGTGLLLYILVAICLPREDRLERAHRKKILGVCARIARSGQMEIGPARLLAVLLFLMTGGAALIGYIILYFVVPDPDSRPSTLPRP